MTGLHSGHCTIRGNDGSYTPLLPNDTTVAKVLNDRYNTACKRLLTPVNPDLGIVPRPWPSALDMLFLLFASLMSLLIVFHFTSSLRQCLVSGAWVTLAPLATRLTRGSTRSSVRTRRWRATTGKQDQKGEQDFRFCTTFILLPPFAPTGTLQ